MYNINIREEIFGGTLSNLETGKREYINKQELEDILKRKKFPKDLVKNSTNKEYNIKFIPLVEQEILCKHFSFADIAFIELTRACNLRCKHCLNDSGTIMPNQLSTDELIKLINDLSNSGIQEIRFTGGEPLLFTDIYKLIRLATEYGLYTSLGTNGTLVTSNLAKQLKEAGLKKAVVSIDGTQSQHDSIRGNGNFEKAVVGLEYLRQEGIEVRVNAVIMRSNMEDVIALAKEMHQTKMPLFIRRFIESGRGANLQNNMLFESDYQYVREQLAYELENGPYVNGHYLRNNEGIHPRIPLPFEIKGCKAGQRAIAIMPDGDMHLCGFLAAQGFPAVDNIRNINDWKIFWNKLQKHDRLAFLRDNLDRYNKIPDVQQTYCLAYIQQFINKEN